MKTIFLVIFVFYTCRIASYLAVFPPFYLSVAVVPPFYSCVLDNESPCRSLYPLKDQVLTEDRDLFYDDIEAHLQQPLRELNAWVSVHQGLIAHSVRTAKLAASSRTIPITEHFPRLNPRRRRRYKPTELLPTPVFFRDTKLTSFVTLTRTYRPRRKKPPAPQEKRPYLRQRSLHNLWPDPLG